MLPAEFASNLKREDRFFCFLVITTVCRSHLVLLKVFSSKYYVDDTHIKTPRITIVVLSKLTYLLISYL